ncbi:MAG: leucine-rich repeat domain-containing protein [Clostridia bacterium]|nr:leucine-rich repeat domain-containing protein [Clostridia bacterium]
MKKKTCKLLSLVLAALMLMSVVPISANAATVMASGKCGENVTWELDSEGTLTISGTGAMWDVDVVPDDSESERYYYTYENQVKKVIITDGVTRIGLNAFEDFECLESVSIAESVTYICDNAFFGCSSLENITLPQSLLHIGDFVFMLTPLKSLHIPANVKFIGGPLVDSAKFEGYTVDENNQYFSVDENGNLFNKDKTKLVHLRFDPALKEYTVPDSVTTIGYFAFGFNFYLEKLIIPDTVTVIEESAFAGTFCLKEINLPEHLQKLGCLNECYNDMFRYGHEKLTIPEVDSYICRQGEWEDADGVLHSCNHYDELNYMYISEIVVYDRDMDFTGLTAGLTTDFKFSPDGLKFCQNVVSRYYADLYAYYNLGYDTAPAEPEINEDEIFEANAEPDFVIDGENYYKIPGFTVRCYPGSTAEEYAKKYDFNIKYICEEHTEETIPAVFPTCTETGLTAGKKCSVCDEILVEQKIVDAKGHDYKTAVTAPTCTEDGFTTYTCACGDSYADDYVDATGHSYTSEMIEEAQCKQDGKMLYVCECGDSYTERIPALDHADADKNSECDRCGVAFCDHICHQDGILGFFWKIMQFFWKMFGTNPVCECGAAHY